MVKEYHYTVRGHWPFPTDMLREDDSAPASESDRQKIEDLSGDFAKDKGVFMDVGITLTGPSMPAVERWNSFDWIVVDIQQRSSRSTAGIIKHRSVGVYPSVEAQQPKKQRVGTIDLTPTWVSTMPVLIAALEDGTETGKKAAREELMRAARILDSFKAKEEA